MQVLKWIGIYGYGKQSLKQTTILTSSHSFFFASFTILLSFLFYDTCFMREQFYICYVCFSFVVINKYATGHGCVNPFFMWEKNKIVWMQLWFFTILDIANKKRNELCKWTHFEFGQTFSFSKIVFIIYKTTANEKKNEFELNCIS